MLLSPGERNATILHPQVAEVLAKFPLPDPEAKGDGGEPSVRKVMAMVEKMTQTRIGPTPSDVLEFYHEIPMRDGFKSSLKIHRPSDKLAPPGAIVVLCFGGSFIGGSPDQLTDVARALVQLAGATVVNINYRLAPEHTFPASQLDGIDSVRWIAENADSPTLSADPSKGFILGGVSAGGGMTAALSRFFQKESVKLAHPLTGQYISIASLMTKDTCPEKFLPIFIGREQNKDAPILDAKALAANNAVTKSDWSSELRCPVVSTTPIEGQPRTYLQVDGLDPTRDDVLVYDEMLKEAGVQTKLDFYPGCPHAHWVLTADYEIGARALIDSVVGLGWLVDKKIARQDAARCLKVQLA